MFLLKLLTSLFPGMLSFMVMVPNSILWTDRQVLCVTIPSLRCSHYTFSLHELQRWQLLPVLADHNSLPVQITHTSAFFTSSSVRITTHLSNSQRPVLCKLTLKERMGKGLGVGTEMRDVLHLSHFYIAQACITVQQTRVSVDYSENCILVSISRSLPI